MTPSPSRGLGLCEVTSQARWDEEKNAVVYHGVVSRGDYWTVVYDKHSKDTWTGSGVGRWDGQVWQSNTRIDWKDDSFRYEDITQGEKFVIEGSRVKPMDVQTAIKEFADFMAGTWTRTEEGVERCHEYEWILGGKFMQSRIPAQIDGLPNFHGISVWRPRRARRPGVAQFSDGGSGVVYLVASGNGRWVFEGDVAGPEGPIHRRITGKRLEPKKLEATLQDTVDGVTQPEVVRVDEAVIAVELMIDLDERAYKRLTPSRSTRASGRLTDGNGQASTKESGLPVRKPRAM